MCCTSKRWTIYRFKLNSWYFSISECNKIAMQQPHHNDTTMHMCCTSRLMCTDFIPLLRMLFIFVEQFHWNAVQLFTPLTRDQLTLCHWNDIAPDPEYYFILQMQLVSLTLFSKRVFELIRWRMCKWKRWLKIFNEPKPLWTIGSARWKLFAVK